MDRERKTTFIFICSGKMNEKCDIAPFLPFLCLRFDWTDSNIIVIVIIIIIIHTHSLSLSFPLIAYRTTPKNMN
jgi:hypothetical protein